MSDKQVKPCRGSCFGFVDGTEKAVKCTGLRECRRETAVLGHPGSGKKQTLLMKLLYLW